jgi:FKBP-type peptidyl-prolyl cis-trans isomerase (trigger factor)
MATNIKVEINKLPESMVAISGEISAENFESYRAEALSHIAKNIEIDGFRKGHVPANIVAEKVGETAILEEMAEMALAKTYPEILLENNIDALGRPEISITKMAKGNPLGFVIKTAVMPEVKLPDIKKVAKESKITEEISPVSDEEIEKTIIEIKKMRAHQDLHRNEEANADSEHSHDHDHAELKEENLPELTDEYVKSLGAFENVEDFKNKLRENITKEKVDKAREKNRVAIIDAIIEKSEVEAPRAFVENELDKMMYRLKTDIENAGMDLEHYMTHIKKTDEDLRKEWEEDAIKRAKLELIMHKISVSENITPDADQIESETAKLIEYYKDVNPERARAYVTQMLTNEKVLQFIEDASK